MLNTTKPFLFISYCLFFLIISNQIQAINRSYISINTFQIDRKPFNFTFSPNPSQEYINIEFTENVTGILYIHDGMIGNPVLQQEINNEKSKSISLQNLKSGIYFISVKTNSNTVIKRLIKY